MTFARPAFLWALVAIPLVVALLARAEVGRRRAAAAFVSPAMRPNIAPTRARWRRWVPPVLYLLGVACLLVGSARPQAQAWVIRERATLGIALDTSESMTATDISPTRLDAARTATEQLLDRLPERFSVGLVGFSSTAQVLSLPTTDRAAIEDALGSITTGQGTAMGDGIAAATEMQETDGAGDPVPMAIVVVSDGNNTTGEVDPIDAARTAQEAGIAVHVVAFAPESSEAGRFKPPDEDQLRAIAEAGGGRFVEAHSVERLEDVYDDLRGRLQRTREPKEMASAFGGLGALLLALGAAGSMLWFRRIA